MLKQNKPSDEADVEQMSRRDFMVGGILLGGAMMLLPTSCAPGHRWVSQIAANTNLPSGIKEKDPHFWFEVLPNNRILMSVPKCEMGQGIFTGLAMLAAEELEMPFEQIDVQPASTKGVEDTMGTGGSQTTVALYRPVREVAARMRMMLIAAAAKEWKVDKAAITAKEGSLFCEDKQMTYAELVAKTDKWAMPGKPILKPSSAFKYVGKSFKRNDALPKVKGDAIYSIDQGFPNTLHGIFIKSPFIAAKAGKIDSSAAEKVKGFEKLIVEEDFIALVAKTRYAAERAARKLKIDWEISKNWTQEDIHKLVAVGVGKKREIMRKGGVKRALANAAGTSLEVAYRMPSAAHAHMEPNGTSALVEGDTVKIIAGLQVLPKFQKAVAKRLGIKKENVLIQNSYLGGGFGRRSFYLDIAQVARIAQIMQQPVHVLNDRTQEFQNGYFRPPTHHVFKGKLSPEGKIIALDYQFASGDVLLNYLPGIASFLMGSDPAASHGARVVYDIKPINVTTWRSELPYQTGAWRGVGMVPNAYALECFMDEMALLAKQDPIDFRLKHLNDKNHSHIRGKKILRHLIDKGYWARAKQENIGRGFAFAEDRKTVVASIVELAIVDTKIKIKRITTIIDAGKIINPEGVKQQIEGCAIMGLSAALYEKVVVKDNQMSVTNFHEYQLPLMVDTPEIEAIILESGEEPFGVGEPPIAPIAGAIANAIFDLTGKRLRNLPLQEAWDNEA